jgi:hypothetical protein
VAEAAIAAKVHEALHRSGNLTAEVSLYLLVALNHLADLVDLLLSKAVRANGLGDASLREDLL